MQPFVYQSTEYDCVPATILNAIRALFNRPEIPPQAIRRIWLYTLDTMDSRGRSLHKQVEAASAARRDAIFGH